MDELLTALIPLEIIEARPEENLEAMEAMCRHLRPEVALVVLPELFSTGFVKDMATFELLAEPLDGPTMQRLCALSKKLNAAIAGSFACRDSKDGTMRNRAFFINPDEDCCIYHYDKHHLFPLSPEHLLFVAGKEQSPQIKFRGWNIGLSICFDLRFPVWNRNVGNVFDLVIVPANWPDSRFHAWQTLVMARAIENIAAYAATNRAGTDQYGTYSYMSTFAVNERGEIISQVHGNTPIRYATFRLDRIKEFRQKFPIYNIADSFTLL